jgi:cobalt-zinc-cadmium efflux system outer membrane protein
MRMVVDRRADMRAAAGRVLAAEKVRDLARALRTRDVVVSGQYERFQGQVTNGTVGVGVSVPLFVNYRFDGEIRRAEAGVGAARDLLERTRAAAVTEINRAWTDLAAARDRVQRFDTALLREATRAADAAEFAYRNGALGVIDLLDARRVLYATRTEAVAAHAELARALWAWRAATTSYEGTE